MDSLYASFRFFANTSHTRLPLLELSVSGRIHFFCDGRFIGKVATRYLYKYIAVNQETWPMMISRLTTLFDYWKKMMREDAKMKESPVPWGIIGVINLHFSVYCFIWYSKYCKFQAMWSPVPSSFLLWWFAFENSAHNVNEENNMQFQ